MSHPTAAKVLQFYRELRRRKVIRSALAYGVAGWVFIEISSTILPAFGVPDWIFRMLVVLVVLGFPVAMFISWYFDIAPEGLERSDPYQPFDDDQADADADAVAEEIEPEPATIAIDLGQSYRAPVTVLCCAFTVDAKGDDDLAAEELIEQLPKLQEIVKHAVEQYQGYRISTRDEEFTLVFGYPSAHEDDARRAVAAGRQIIRAVTKSGAAEENLHRISAAIAIHSGTIVAKSAEDLSVDVSLVGPTTRIAAWLSQMSNPDSILITDDTFRLVQNFFLCTQHDQLKERHSGKEFRVYRVERSTDSEARADYLKSTAETIVGRDHELRLLRDCWANNENGDGQFVLLRGGPGIGKSAIVRSFCRDVGSMEEAVLVPCFCSPFEINHPLHPIIDYMHSEGLGHIAERTPEQSLQLLGEFTGRVGITNKTTIGLLAALLSIPVADDGYVPRGAPGMIRKQMLESILTLLESAAETRPVLMLIEDLHWADPSTIELVNMLVNKGPSDRLFCLFTARPQFEAEWQSAAHVMQLDLRSLSQKAVIELVERTRGDLSLPRTLFSRIVNESGGVPLFAEELTKSVLESLDFQAKSQNDGPDSFESLEIPATLKQSLAARIDNLNEAKSTLQLCSMLGREFDYAMLLAISKTENEEGLRKDLDKIVRAGMLFQQGMPPTCTYTFKHILIQESANDSLLRKTRVSLHRTIAETLEAEFPELQMTKPQVLARHFDQAGIKKKAAKYWTSACHKAVSAFASAEANVYAENGLASCKEIDPSVERDGFEVALESMRGKALQATLGYADPAVGSAFARALALCKKIGDTPQIFQILGGLWMFYAVSAKFKKAQQLAERLLRIATATNDPVHLVQARYCLAFTIYYLGDCRQARELLLQALADEVPGHDYTSASVSGDDTRAHIHCLLSQVLWHLGSLQTSLAHSLRAVEIVKELKHPYGMAYMGFMNAMLHLLRDEPEQVKTYAAPALKVAEEKGYQYWQILNRCMLAWADAALQKDDSPESTREYMETMAKCIDGYRQIGAGTGQTWLRLLLTEKFIMLGEFTGARKQLEIVEKEKSETGEINFASELPRIRVQLDRSLDDSSNGNGFNTEEARTNLQSSIRMAREVGSIMLELKSTNDLVNYGLADREAEADANHVEQVLARFKERDVSCDRFLSENNKAGVCW